MLATVNLTTHEIRAGMVGLGMIFDETYRPFFEQLHAEGLYRRDFGFVDVELAAVASRTGSRGERYRSAPPAAIGPFVNFAGPDAIGELLGTDVDAVCVATPDDRHFDAARLALEAGKHVLIEKPSVLRLQELDELDSPGPAARTSWPRSSITSWPIPITRSCARTCVDGVLQHVNNGYCSLLEPKSISGEQFAEWITGPQSRHLRRRALHQADRFHVRRRGRVGPGIWPASRATGQRGLVGPADGTTWDSVQLQMVYAYPDGREAAFDIHTSWVTPDNFPGYVEQEVQFRFDNGVWNAHQRKRGVEVTIEGKHAAARSRTRPTIITTAPSSSRGATAASAATASR